MQNNDRKEIHNYISIHINHEFGYTRIDKNSVGKSFDPIHHTS